jgi:hypothetical protein
MMDDQRACSSVLTASGRRFDLLDPETAEFDIYDIAHALSHLCRYTGHCREFYSVAQHSVLVSRIVPAQHALAGLLHDAAEAFIGDVATPLKALLPDYREIEARIEAVVFRRFGLPLRLPDCVKQADQVLLCTELRDLMAADPSGWPANRNVQAMRVRIDPQTPAQARDEFLRTFGEIAERHQTRHPESSAPCSCVTMLRTQP